MDGVIEKGIVFSGFRIPRNLANYSLAVYLVPEVDSFWRFTKIIDAWQGMVDSGNISRLVSILNKYGIEEAVDICVSSLVDSGLFIDFWQIIERKNPVLKKIKEDYLSILKVLKAMAARKMATIIVGDVAQRPYNLITDFFKKRYQNNKSLMKNSKAVVVNTRKKIWLETNTTFVKILAINGSRLLEFAKKKEIDNSQLIFVSKIGDGIELSDWVNLDNKSVFMADNIINGAIPVGNYSVTFDF